MPAGAASHKGDSVNEQGLHPAYCPGRGVYQLPLTDVEAGQAVLMGTIREAVTPTIFVLRVKAAADRLSEIETLVIRNQSAAENLERVARPRRAWFEPVPERKRVTRNELVRIANMYFSGIEENDGKGTYPLSKTCARLENGSVTAGDPVSCLASLRTQQHLAVPRPAVFNSFSRACSTTSRGSAIAAS